MYVEPAVSKETSVEIVGPQPRPFTVQMCFVDLNIYDRSNRDILLNIQIIQCKPDEICDPARESQYYGHGLGYVFFHRTCVIIRAGLPILFSW